MMRAWVLVYGVAGYVAFLATFLYLCGFVGNFGVPVTLDSPATEAWWYALLINAGLVGIFALQHSGMARPAFKTWWTRIVPEPMERPTYVFMSCFALALVCWQWQPIGGAIWNVEQPWLRGVLYTVFGMGWVSIVVSSFFINHFDLFGLRQVWLYWKGQPYTHLPFKVPGPYKYVRHPLYVGWLLGFWVTPTMTGAHLVFALGMTAYILVAIRWEEADLIKSLGTAYRHYRERVPMLIPGRAPTRAPTATAVLVRHERRAM